MLPLIGSWRDVLFPGFVPIGLAIAAVTRACRSDARQSLPVRPHVVGFYLAIGMFAMWASFGPDAGLYGALYYTVPFFSLLRAPARFGDTCAGSSMTLIFLSTRSRLGRRPCKRRRAAIEHAKQAMKRVGHPQAPDVELLASRF
jgi:hypothetical protein